MAVTKERRKFMRITTQLDAEYLAKGPSLGTGQAQIRDFSREGVGGRFSQTVTPGEYVDLTLRVPGDNVPIFATAEVAWAQVEQGTSKVEAGLKLKSIKPLDLARLLDFVYSRWLGSIKESL